MYICKLFSISKPIFICLNAWFLTDISNLTSKDLLVNLQVVLNKWMIAFTWFVAAYLQQGATSKRRYLFIVHYDFFSLKNHEATPVVILEGGQQQWRSCSPLIIVRISRLLQINWSQLLKWTVLMKTQNSEQLHAIMTLEYSIHGKQKSNNSGGSEN